MTAMDQCRALAPPGSNPVEQILADRVVLAPLQQTYHEIRMTAVAGNVDVAGSEIGNSLEKRLLAANRELADATKNYQKGFEFAAEISPPTPQSGVVALKSLQPTARKLEKAIRMITKEQIPQFDPQSRDF